MKLKMHISFFSVFMLIFLLGISCEDEILKDYEPVPLADTITAEVSIQHIADSSAGLSYEMEGKGRFSYALVLANSVDSVTARAILNQNVEEAVQSGSIKITANNKTDTVDFTGLLPNTAYQVFVLATNGDGVNSEVIQSDSFTTTDNGLPVVSEVIPAVEQAASQPKDFAVALVFSESVKVSDARAIEYGYYDASSGHINVHSLVDSLIRVSNDTVEFDQPVTPQNGQFVFLSIGSSAITDLSSNAYEGVASGWSQEDEPAGNYWRIVKDTLPVSSVGPVDDTLNTTDFTIRISYPENIKMNSEYDSTMLGVTYTTGNYMIKRWVRQVNIEVSDSLASITLPEPAKDGETVGLQIDNGTFFDAFDNPVEGLNEDFWIIDTAH